MHRPLILLALSVVLALGSVSRADNWPNWRGPTNNGVSTAKGVPEKWSKTENVLWRVALPGPGGATPVLWNDRIFLTTAKDRDLLLVCVSTDGKKLWERKLGTGDRTVNGDEGNYASPSPSTDGKQVYAMIGTGILTSFDFEGNEKWRVDLQQRYGKFNIQYGMASSPVLDKDRLYVQLLHSGAELVVALNTKDGKEVWKQIRPSDAVEECLQSYASPIVYRDSEREFLLTHGADYTVAHKLSDGSELWRCGGLNPQATYNPTLRFVASPTAADGLIVVPTAKNGPVLGLRPDGKGDVTDNTSTQVWRMPAGTPDVPSPVIHDGLVYLCRENGAIYCLDAASGEIRYKDKRPHSDRHRASPVFADGKLYCTAHDGTVSVVKAGPQYELLATNTLGEPMSASPVIVNGRIYLRTFEALYAIGKQ